jgi:hypothetical protein
MKTTLRPEITQENIKNSNFLQSGYLLLPYSTFPGFKRVISFRHTGFIQSFLKKHNHLQQAAEVKAFPLFHPADFSLVTGILPEKDTDKKTLPASLSEGILEVTEVHETFLLM